MDPNKDFIHIDDVFKSLKNGEEQERPGAWLSMKDLLDKEMPIGTAVSAGRSFRRYIVPLVALLLIGGGAAYYKISDNYSNNNIAVTENSAAADRFSNELNRNVNNEPKGAIAAVPPSGKDKRNTHAGSRTAMPGSENSPAQNNSIPSPDAVAVVAAGNNKKANNNTDVKPWDREHKVTGSSNKKAENKGNTVNETVIANQNKAVLIEEQNIIEQIRPKSANSATTGLLASNTTKDNTAVEPVLQPGSDNKPNLKQIAQKLNDKKIVQSTEGYLYKEERDTFKRVDVMERYASNSGINKNKRPQTVIDTVAITRVEKISYVPLTKVEVLALQKMKVNISGSTVVPMAGLKERTVSREMVSFVPLNKYKVGSRKVDPGKFNMLVKNTTGGIANYFDGSRNFYAAILLGGNASFGTPGAFGMQLGIAGIYSISERLSLMAELRFANHYFSNYTLEDKSVAYDNVTSQQVSGAQWLFSGTEYTTTSAYKMNSFYTLEMPLMLSYSLGRVSVFGGANLAYASSLKWDKQIAYNSTPVQKTQEQNKIPFTNTGYQVNEQNDFASRLGIGYVFGVNYEMSRKLSLDARMTQILADNAQGNINTINKLFRMPTMQLSIGYYFGRKDKVTYIMDRK